MTEGGVQGSQLQKESAASIPANELSQEKISARQQLIEKLNTLFLEAFHNGLKGIGRGGLSGKQKWFTISASLGHTLARLVSDLEFERMRLDVERLKKMVIVQDVANQRITFPQARHGFHREAREAQGEHSNPD